MEQQPQPSDGVEPQQRHKTLGIRIDEDLHAQLTFIAQLTESTISDEIKRSIEARVQAAQNDPELITRAEQVRADIEREAEARKQAIANLFGGVALADEVETPRPVKRGGRTTRNEAADDNPTN